MKKLVLIRAGSTAWQEDSQEEFCCGSKPTDDESRLQGRVPLPLSETDKKALKEIAVILRQEDAEVIYNSGNESAGPTAEYLSELCSIKTKEDPNLRELDCGLWQGLKIKDIKKRYGRAYRQWHSDPASICPPQGECLVAAGERICEALQKIAKKNKDKIVVVIAAPIAAALIECILNHGSLDKFWHFAENPKQLQAYDLRSEETFNPPAMSDEETDSEGTRIHTA